MEIDNFQTLFLVLFFAAAVVSFIAGLARQFSSRTLEEKALLWSRSRDLFPLLRKGCWR
jgi:hypothetical protein